MNDLELLAKIRTPETRNYGFNMLVRAYQQRVYGLVRKMVIDHDNADDLTQEVFIKVHKSIDSFREDSQLYTWIYRIATNESLTFLNKKRKRFFLPLEDVGKELSSKIDSMPSLDGDEIQKKLQKALLRVWPSRHSRLIHWPLQGRDGPRHRFGGCIFSHPHAPAKTSQRYAMAPPGKI